MKCSAWRKALTGSLRTYSTQYLLAKSKITGIFYRKTRATNNIITDFIDQSASHLDVERNHYFKKAMNKHIQLVISMIAVIIILTVPRNSLAQSSRLKVGDDVPDIALKNLINYKTDSERLHSFKDKFIILYFW